MNLTSEDFSGHHTAAKPKRAWFNLGAVYILALSLIAVMSIATFLVMTTLISYNEQAATLINVSGKQRMLSQRIALYSHELERVSLEERSDVRQELRNMLDEFKASHDDMIHGNAERNLQPLRSKTVRQILYEAPYQLDKKLHDYIARVETILAIAGDDLARSDFQTISPSEATQLLQILDRVVKTHENESRDSIAILHIIEKVILSSVLFVLLMEALFLFRPLVKQIKRKTQALENEQERLKSHLKTQRTLNGLLHYLNKPHGSLQQLIDGFMDIMVAIDWLDVDKKGGVFIFKEDSQDIAIAADKYLPKDFDVSVLHEDVFEKQKFDGYFSMPLVHKNKVIGLMTLYLSKEQKNNETSSLFLESASEILSMAVIRQINETS